MTSYVQCEQIRAISAERLIRAGRHRGRGDSAEDRDRTAPSTGALTPSAHSAARTRTRGCAGAAESGEPLSGAVGQGPGRSRLPAEQTARHGLHTSRAQRAVRVAALPRHDELRPHTDEADSHAIMDAAHDAGINFFDTANVYGWGEQPRPHRGDRRHLVRQRRRPPRADGHRHQALRRHAARRPGHWPNNGKLSALNIRRALDASLKRLQTDYIDLYQMHHIDRATPWEEIWQAMETAVAAGQDPLRRQQQLRRLAHRPGPGGRGRAGTSPAWSASSRSTTCSSATSSSR